MDDRGYKIRILIAEDNDISRELMAGMLKTQGHEIFQAVDGSSAITVVRDNDIDIAIVDQMMAPMGGFEFAQHLIANGIDLPVIMVTAHDASDVLLEAGKYGIMRVIQKPVDPPKLIAAVNHLLRRKGLSPAPLAVESRETKFPPGVLMQRVIEAAARNAATGKGGPFAALVADAEGKILGEGASGQAGRADPVAHAEVMAIRRACERLGRSELESCILYCSAEPDRIGKALIASVGIGKVCYALKLNEMADLLGPPKPEIPVDFIQMSHDEALTALSRVKKP